MKIGNLEINEKAYLAPMAGVADRAFRELCRGYGAAYTVCEMASAKGISLGDKKSRELLSIEKDERPAGAQLFGNSPETMAKAAEASNGGAWLMKNPQLAGEIVKAVVSVSTVPVTVKMRSGWDSEHINAVELAKICEQAGAAAITVHG